MVQMPAYKLETTGPCAFPPPARIETSIGDDAHIENSSLVLAGSFRRISLITYMSVMSAVPPTPRPAGARRSLIRMHGAQEVPCPLSIPYTSLTSQRSVMSPSTRGTNALRSNMRPRFTVITTERRLPRSTSGSRASMTMFASFPGSMLPISRCWPAAHAPVSVADCSTALFGIPPYCSTPQAREKDLATDQSTERHCRSRHR